jgi:diketogulonate reductase-like aldo/keto reductase
VAGADLANYGIVCARKAFQVEHLEHVLSLSEPPPSLNQIEMHPANHCLEGDFLSFYRRNDIAIAAYCPLRKSDTQLLEHSSTKAIASGHSKTTAQLLLRWPIQKSFIALPKSATPQRIAENIDAYDFE